jgi:hypothetical protein
MHQLRLMPAHYPSVDKAYRRSHYPCPCILVDHEDREVQLSTRVENAGEAQRAYVTPSGFMKATT